MTTKTKVGVILGIIVVSFALGRYSVPTKTKDETKTTSNKRTKSDKHTHKKDHKVTTITQDASGHKVTTIVDDSTTASGTTKDTSDHRTTDTTHEVIRSGGYTNISALAGLSLTNGTLVYGGQIQRDLLGPINAGLYGFTDGRFGLSLGLRF